MLPAALFGPGSTHKTAHKLGIDVEETAQVSQLWSGLANEVCFRRHAHHIAFPRNDTAEHECSTEDKLVLIGASILVDVALFEKEDDDEWGNK